MQTLTYASRPAGLWIELRPVTLRGLLEAQTISEKDVARTNDWLARHVRRVEVGTVSIRVHFDGAVDIDERELCPTFEQAREILLSLPLGEWREVLDLLKTSMAPKREDADPLGAGQGQP